MISPVERINAFSQHRLSKKQEGGSFEIAGRLVISPTKYSIFTFIHILNRTIVNSPLVFWINIVISFLQLATCVVSPFNHNYWSSFPQILPIIKVLIIVLRFVPFDAPAYITYTIFAVYLLLILTHFILIMISITQSRSHKDNRTLLQVLFIYSFFVGPILRSSITCILSEMFSKMVRDPSFGNFFLSLLSLIFIVMLFFNNCFAMFAMSSAPNPNMSNPVAAWAPDAWCSVHYEAFLLFTFILQETTRRIPKFGYGIYLFFFAVIVIGFFFYLARIDYLISYTALEYMLGLYLATAVFYIFLGIFGVINADMPLYLFLIFWVLTPGATVFSIRGYFGHKIRKILFILDECGIPAEGFYDNNTNQDENAPLMSDPILSSIFSPLKIKNSRDAIFIARSACFCNHPLYEDLSLIKYLIEIFPSAQFSFLHLAYLMPHHYEYVNRQIELYLRDNRPNFLYQCILFQIVSGIQESSSELPTSILKEISQQTLHGMKCQQLLAKYWTTCYKGDITQMARHAFILYRHINDLSKRWRLLVLRYPFSTPVLKEYVNFLQAVKMEHKLADSILQNRPQLIDQTTQQDNDSKSNVLYQSVEEAVDRRPIYSLSKVRLSFGVTVLISVIFLIAATAVGLSSFFRIKTAASYIYNIDASCAYLTHVPNLNDDEKFGVTNARERLFMITTTMGNMFSLFLNDVPQKVFQASVNMTLPIHFKLNNFIEDENMTAYSAMRHITYFSRALSFVVNDDPMEELVVKNILNTFILMTQLSSFSLNELENSMKIFNKLAPYFYIFCWVLLLVIMIPLVYFSLSSLKQEITYLFALYLTIPRSTVNKLIELGNNAKAERRAAEMLTSSSFVHTTRQFGQTEERDEDDENIADGFKMLVSDSSSQNFSVFPRFFIVKCSGMIFIIVSIIAIIACISYHLFTDYTNKAIKCLYTIHVSALRMMYATILMHGVSSKTDYPVEVLDQYLKVLIDVNSALLYSSDNFNISSNAVNSDLVRETQFGTLCDNSTNISCKNMIDTFDIFINEVSNLTALLTHGKGDSITDQETANLRRMFNDNLAGKLSDLTESLFLYTDNMMSTAIIINVVLLLVPLFFLLVIMLFCVKPVFEELIDTIQSVKLPLKHITPMDLADLPKLMQYLQGESDWKRGQQSEKANEESGGNSVLNAMLCPFAIFEEDLALLFANAAFYTMLGTTREATVGLQMEEIFSPIMNFKENENHPFNSLLETVQQLHRGVSPVRIAEITTDVEIPNQIPCPVMVRLVGICFGDESLKSENDAIDNLTSTVNHGKLGNSNNNNTNNNSNVNNNNNEQQHMLKAKQYAVFLTDLSQRKMTEEKLKYETDISQKLIDGAIPRALASSLREGNELVPRTYKEIPTLMFSLQFPAEEDGDDDLMVACSLFLRTTNDMVHTFSSITKITHTPPVWVFTAGMNSSDQNDLAFNTGELANFALSIIDVYSNSASTTCSLTALMTVGEITILPVNSQLPFVEVFGPGYTILKASIPILSGNALYATEMAQNVLSSLPDVAGSIFGNLKDNEGISRQYYSVKRNSETTRLD